MQQRSRLTDLLLRTTLLGLIGCGAPAVNSGGTAGSSGNGSGNGGPSGSGSGGIQLGPVGSNPGTGGQGTPETNQPSTNNNCGVKKIDLQKQPADLLLVLDRSRSMLQDVNGNGQGGRGDAGVAGPSRWTEVVAAIDPVVMRTQTQVAWGLKLYPLQSSCGVPDGASVPVAVDNHTQIMTAIRAADPGVGDGGSTPTRVAVDKATAFMKSTPSTNAKYLVLATDGLPNCGNGGRNGNDPDGAIAAVASAAAAGIPTFVVGVATAGSDAHDTLNEMAVKGGRPRGDATKYFPVASRDELVSTLETITGQIASCTFPLSPTPPVPDNVAVELDGQRVPRDDSGANGWSYGPQNNTLILHGAKCDELKAGTAKNVQILYGCPGVTIN